MNSPAPPYSFLIVYEQPSDCISLYTQHFRHSLEPFPTQRGYSLFGSGEKQSAFPICFLYSRSSWNAHSEMLSQ